MDWFLIALKKYATFSGRAQRAEYWYFALFATLLLIGAHLLDDITGLRGEEARVGLLEGILSLALLIPSLAVGVRRLHDTGRSGWWLLIWLVPLVGVIVILVFTVQDSAVGDNAYGPNPKGITS